MQYKTKTSQSSFQSGISVNNVVLLTDVTVYNNIIVHGTT